MSKGKYRAFAQDAREDDPEEDPLMRELLEEHAKEARRRHATFHNMGWGMTDTGIASKTSVGILSSEIDPKTKRVTHEWNE